MLEYSRHDKPRIWASDWVLEMQDW